VQDSQRLFGRFIAISLFAGATAAVVSLSPPAHADDNMIAPDQPLIVAGGTVHPSTTIVVDPQTPAGPTAPIDPSKPIGVDPNATPPKPTIESYTTKLERMPVLEWHPNSNPPVVQREARYFGEGHWVFLDSVGRYWDFSHKPSRVVLEQVGGWPAPPPPVVNNTGPDSNQNMMLIPDCRRVTWPTPCQTAWG
jgi:hypothetical protein